MAKPVILAVDDDPQVLRAVERDLRRRYAREYRILRADSGESALDTLGKLKLRGDPVALFLVDQRMPKMTGVATSITAGRMRCSRFCWPAGRARWTWAFSTTTAGPSTIRPMAMAMPPSDIRLADRPK